jgi:hypothetical protein
MEEIPPAVVGFDFRNATRDSVVWYRRGRYLASFDKRDTATYNAYREENPYEMFHGEVP